MLLVHTYGGEAHGQARDSSVNILEVSPKLISGLGSRSEARREARRALEERGCFCTQCMGRVAVGEGEAGDLGM